MCTVTGMINFSDLLSRFLIRSCINQRTLVQKSLKTLFSRNIAVEKLGGGLGLQQPSYLLKGKEWQQKYTNLPNFIFFIYNIVDLQFASSHNTSDIR